MKNYYISTLLIILCLNLAINCRDQNKMNKKKGLFDHDTYCIAHCTKSGFSNECEPNPEIHDVCD